MPTIRLPFGGGQTIETDDVLALFEERGVEHLTLSARRVALEDHPRPLSLDYWIRQDMEAFGNVAQATRDLERSLCESGLFESVIAECPSGGRMVRSIRRTEEGRVAHLPGLLDTRAAMGVAPPEVPGPTTVAPTEEGYIERTAGNVAAFVEHRDDLAEGFDWAWTVPTEVADLLDGIEPVRASGMRAATTLKNAVRRRLGDDLAPEGRRMLFTFFVRDFGGVRANRRLSERIDYVEALVARHGEDTPDHTGLDKISTISKCLTLLDETWPIYDARVGFSLNALNWLAGDRDLFLPMPQGRNTRLGLVDLRTLFLLDRTERRADTLHDLSDGRDGASRALERFCIPKDRAYGVYRRVLQHAAELPGAGRGASIDTLEMGLFAHASTTILRELIETATLDGGR